VARPFRPSLTARFTNLITVIHLVHLVSSLPQGPCFTGRLVRLAEKAVRGSLNVVL